MPPELTILNTMAGPDFTAALDQHRAWGIRSLDLKDKILGKALLDLSDDEARRVSDLIAAAGLRTWCFSTTLFYEDVDAGREAFAATLAGKIDRTIQLAKILRPQIVRLLAARSATQRPFTTLAADHPWLIPLYQEAVDRLADAGLHVTIENECHHCILATPDDVLEFFARLDRQAKVHFTWDVQNFWQMGTFPTLDVYHQLKPFIGYYHVKGGMTEDGNSPTPLKWRSSLEDASWPVEQITRQVVADNVSPIICLNPPHGVRKPGYDDSNLTARDLAFLRRITGSTP